MSWLPQTLNREGLGRRSATERQLYIRNGEKCIHHNLNNEGKERHTEFPKNPINKEIDGNEPNTSTNKKPRSLFKRSPPEAYRFRYRKGIHPISVLRDFRYATATLCGH